MTTYYVDDRLQTADTGHVTVEQILARAGVGADIEELLLVELRGDRAIEHPDPDGRIALETDQRFRIVEKQDWWRTRARARRGRRPV